MVNVKVTTKRCVSAVMAFLMVAMLVLGVSASPLTQVFAASATKKLKSGDVTVELDKSCAATNVSVDIKTAAEGLHDFTDDPYVHNYLDYMFGDNGLSGIINLTDKDGNKVVPDSPNAFKFEAFLFDAFGEVDDMAILRVKREEEFAPVKNADSAGVDCPSTARELYNNFYKKN